MSRIRRLAAATLGMAALVAVSLAEIVVFPNDPSVKNVKLAFGAVGDGVADDTEALRKAFTTANVIVYLPNGVYRITAPIICRGLGTGPWITGQSREGVIIRLDNDAPGYGDPQDPKPVIAATNHLPGKGISADQFFRQWHNFTIDAGNNSGAIGVRYYGNNSSVLGNVKIRGQGLYALDLGWVDQNGPCLIRDVIIEGFTIGLHTERTINSQTVSGLTIRNSREIGVFCKDQSLTIEDLTVEGTPVAVDAAGIVCIIDASLTGTDSTKPAIRNGGILYCRSIRTRNFSRAIESPEGGVSGSTVSEYISEKVISVFDKSAATSLSLPIKKPSVFAWEEDLSKWVCVNDFGAATSDNRCDAKAFQAAIDTAAAQGKSTVYIRPSSGPDPNWYLLTENVYLHGSVRHILGMGFARVVASGKKGFVLREDAAPIVKIQNIYSFGGPSRSIVSNDASTLIIEDCDGFTIRASGRGDIFINNSVGSLQITNSGAHVWARQWNTEGNDIDTDNEGGKLWILGLKTEKGALKIRTTRGGSTELLGAHIYNICTMNAPHPLFEIGDASASFACVREVCYCGKEKWYTEHVRETRSGETKTWLQPDKAWALYSGSGTVVPKDNPGIQPRRGGEQPPVRRGRRLR